MCNKVTKGGSGSHDGARALAADLDPKGLGLERDLVEPVLAGAAGGAGEVQGHWDLVPWVLIVIDL